jgi:hypothetical protein
MLMLKIYRPHWTQCDDNNNSNPTPQGVENRNIRLWFKGVLTALHVNCMILFDKVMYLI